MGNSSEQPAETALASDPARAREERVDHIVGLMARGEWRAAASHRDLAVLWGVSVGSVQDYAREASGILRHLVEGDVEGIRAAVVASVERIRVDALANTRTWKGKQYPSPDYRSALMAVELQAKLLGLIVNKADVRVSPVDNMSEDEVNALLLEEAKRIEGAKGA